MALSKGSLRKCLVKKWHDEKAGGYGFNLHAEVGKAGHFIGKIDEASPAELAGLKEGDRIIEVNDVNIGNENHKQVVSRIKASGDSVWLLVIDKEGDEVSKNNRIVLSTGVEEMQVVECPDSRPSDDGASEETVEPPAEPENPPAAADVHDADPAGDDSEEELPPPPPELSALDAAVNSASADDPSQSNTSSAPETEEPQTEISEAEPEEPVSAEAAEEAPPQAKEEEEEEKEAEPSAPATPPEPEEPPKPVDAPAENGVADPPQPTETKPDVVPKMTAAQMREALAKNKKPDPRKDKSIATKDKLKMFQNL